MSVINTNYLALVSQNNLTKSQNSLGTAIERLSSGLRINSAKDDAAGQAIANRFTANINGLSQAARNANDGISVAQTTEGALNEINENLQRIRTLTVQATTGSNSKTDLESIQAEIAMRMSEIDRVSEQTQFNGVKVLASNQTLSVQVGANDSETISVNLSRVTSEDLGLAKLDMSNIAQTVKVGDNVSVKTEDAAAVTTTTYAWEGRAVTASESYSLHKAGDNYYAVDSGDPTKYYAVTASNASASGVTLTVANTAEVGTPTGVAAATSYEVSAAQTAGTTEGKAALDLGVAPKGNSNSLIKLGDDYFIRSTDSNGKNTYYDVEAAAGTDGTITFKGTAETTKDIDAALGAPLDALDAALSSVDSLRSDLGAIQNRFQSTIANLNNTVNNLSAARSRIEDADYAVEVSNMTRSQILQQAGTSVLAQANQVPQTVLSLLR